MPEQCKDDSERGEQCSERGKEHADLCCLVLHNQIRWQTLKTFSSSPALDAE